jgi:hypothetical protein
MPSHEALDPRLTAARPRSDALAAVVKRAAVAVRGIGGSKVIGRIKGSATVQRLLYRPLEGQPDPPDAALEDLDRHFAPEVDLASKLTGLDLLAPWPRYRLATDGPAERGATDGG